MIDPFSHTQIWQRGLLALGAFCLFASSARADVTMPSIFSDHMVLQRDAKIPIWGWASPGEQVKVTFGDRTASTRTGADGSWRVNLGKGGANASPRTLTVTGKNTITFSDVLVGDVWLCSGQSNMGVYLGETDTADVEVPKADDPLLRLYSVSGATAIEPAKDITPSWNRKWVPSDPKVASQFTAVGYFFGRELRRDLNIPIGLISAPYGGTRIQMWIDLAAFEKHLDADPEFPGWMDERGKRATDYAEQEALYLPIKAKYDADMKDWWTNVYAAPDFAAKRAAWDVANKAARLAGKPPLPLPQPSVPRPAQPDPPDGGPYTDYMVGNCYNAMIAPLIPFAIKGVTWYQGESNDKNSKQYATLFPILIDDWRDEWGQGNFPFLFVQLPNINKPATQPVQNGDRWPGMREAQADALSLPNTGMATIIDVGDPYNVHGKDKIDVGTRLSLVARHLVYGEDIVSSGPTYDSIKVEGNKIRIAFKNVGGGLEIGVPPWTVTGIIPPLADEVKGFAIAGDDRKWYWADTKIEGDTVLAWSDQVPNPVAVRYGWADNPPCNLYNKEKLPAAPFRTDRWDP